jgi:MFS family permease
MFFMFFVSVYVAENTLGTPAIAGYANSLFKLGQCELCFALGKIYKKINKIVILLAYAGVGITLFITMAIPTIPALYITSILRGGFVGLATTYCITVLPTFVPKERSKDAIGFFTSMYSLAIFTTPFVVSWVLKSIGNGRYTPTIIVPVIVCATIFSVQFFLNRKQPKENLS